VFDLLHELDTTDERYVHDNDNPDKTNVLFPDETNVRFPDEPNVLFNGSDERYGRHAACDTMSSTAMAIIWK